MMHRARRCCFVFLAVFFAGALSVLAGLAESTWAQSERKDEWEKTLRAAEAEGQITLYGCCYEYDRILEEFRKKYPRIKVTTVVAAGSQLGPRVLAERRGDKYLPDVFGGGANTLHDILYTSGVLQPIKPTLMLPEVVDLSKWYQGEHRFIDPEKKYIFAFVANSQSGQVSYNTQQVHPSAFKSFWDLVNPKWKGKIASLDPTAAGMGGTLQLFYYHPDLGPAFIRKLFGEMQVTVSRDSRQMTDWLAAGKVPLCIRCSAGGEIGKAKEQGLPIDFLDTEDWKEGGSSSASGGTLGFADRAPHPHAARVFINWFLSRQGQSAFQKLGRRDAHNSRRIDIPKDDVDPSNRLDPGKKYFDLARPEYQDVSPIFKLVKEVLPQK